MRVRIPLLVLLIGSLAWLGCDEQMAPESSPDVGPSFAGKGPAPEACDLKDLPLKDYFSKTGAQEVSALVKDLSSACAYGLGSDALNIGFNILTYVETQRPNVTGATGFAAGGQIVAGVWGAMNYNLLATCTTCANFVIDWEDVADALQYGAFGVRSAGSAPVVSYGTYPYIWGMEPPDGYQWSAVVPAGKALIYGFPVGLGALGDPSLTTGFDWSVVPWHAVTTTATTPLEVGTCVPSTGANVGLVSHEPPGGLPSLLPRGDSPSYCTVQASLGDRMLQFASLAVPFWPAPLNASAFVGVSGSGKAREFSPFHQYDVAPYAKVTFTPVTAPDGTANLDVCGTSPCTTVTWKTEGGSSIASSETLRFTTEANSSSWAEVYLCVVPKYKDGSYGAETSETCGIEPQLATCDGRDAVNPCVGLAVTEFVSDKTGSHRICVSGAGGVEASGLAFDACTPTFNIRP